MTRKLRASNKSTSRSNSAKGFLLFLLVILPLCLFMMMIGLFIGFWYFDQPTGLVSAEGIRFSVASGESGMAIARKLSQAGIIRSEWFFRLMMKLRQAENTTRSGIYQIESIMTGTDIIELLNTGPQLLARLVIPEGKTLHQVATLIENAGISSVDSILDAAHDTSLLQRLEIPADTLEGYLFPDTYFFVTDSPAEEVLEHIVQNFRSNLNKLGNISEGLDVLEIHHKLIVASIVEREYRLPEEAALMASAFYNRLEKDMLLQSCATVVYVITEELNLPHPSRIYHQDLVLSSPFNTYQNSGLPPTPICSPGLVAMRAAFSPATTPYLYFRLIDEATGAHFFSITLDEHNQAAALSTKP